MLSNGIQTICDSTTNDAATNNTSSLYFNNQTNNIRTENDDENTNSLKIVKLDFVSDKSYKMDVDRMDIETKIEKMEVDGIEERRENLKRQRDNSFESKMSNGLDNFEESNSLSLTIFDIISKTFNVKLSNCDEIKTQSSVIIDLNEIKPKINPTDDYKNIIQFILMDTITNIMQYINFDDCYQYFSKFSSENFPTVVESNFRIKKNNEFEMVNFTSFKNKYILALSFVIDSFNRSIKEGNMAFDKYETPIIRDLFVSIKNQCISFVAFIIIESKIDVFLINFFLQLLYSERIFIHTEFLTSFIVNTYNQYSKENFNLIIRSILNGLWMDMNSNCSFIYDTYKLPLQVLSIICNVSVGKSNYPVGELVNILLSIIYSLFNFYLFFKFSYRNFLIGFHQLFPNLAVGNSLRLPLWHHFYVCRYLPRTMYVFFFYLNLIAN